MATLIQTLALAGCRKSDGTANASGLVFLYAPGTTTLVPGYKDEGLSQVWTTTGGGIPLDLAGRANIWVNQQVDVAVFDSSGSQVSSLLGFNGVTADTVVIENPGYTGTLTDAATGNQTQGAGGVTDLNTVLTRATDSFGATDFGYAESTGSTRRRYQDVVREIHVTPQDFGAKGNGIVDDTAAILNARNELGRLGSGVLYFPPGSYACSALIQIGLNGANAQGISLEGAGSGSSILKFTTSVAGLVMYSTRARIQGLSLTNSVGSDVNMTYLDIENAVNVIVEDVVTDAKSRFACVVRGASEVILRANKFAAADGDALAVGLTLSGNSHVRVFGNSIIGGSSGLGIYYLGTNTALDASIDANTFSNCGLAGIAFQSSDGVNPPTGVSLVNNHSLGALTVPILPLATVYGGLGVLLPQDWTQTGNNIDGYTVNVTSGGAHTPTISKGRFIRIVGTTTGSAYLIAAPDWVPSIRGQEVTIEFVNAAGGAVTGWTLAAGYVLAGAVPIPTTDLHSIQVKFAYDVGPNKWREVSGRADTLT